MNSADVAASNASVPCDAEATSTRPPASIVASRVCEQNDPHCLLSSSTSWSHPLAPPASTNTAQHDSCHTGQQPSSDPHPTTISVTASWDAFPQHQSSLHPSIPTTTTRNQQFPLPSMGPDLWDFLPMHPSLASHNATSTNTIGQHIAITHHSTTAQYINSTSSGSSSSPGKTPTPQAASPASIPARNTACTHASEGNGSGSDDEELLPSKQLVHPFSIASAPSQGITRPSETRELLIYAIPLHPKELVFLPVCSWKQPVKQFGEGVGGRMHRGITKFGSRLKNKAAEMWQGMGQDSASVVSKKVYDVGQAVLESTSPEERLLQAIPKNVTKIIIYHPAQVPPDQLRMKLAGISSSTGLKSAGKAAEASKGTASALGGARLARYIGNADGSGCGGAGTVRMNYFLDSRLDRYIALAEDSVEGVLAEEDIVAMCEELNQEELLQPLSELRRRHMRNTARKRSQGGGAEYSLLKSQGSGM
ncbi:MAG: hypothetical protein WDW38_000143 [Sanguina aurantia]